MARLINLRPGRGGALLLGALPFVLLIVCYLFGSAARNELTPESDIDLLVEFSPQSGVSLLDMPALQAELSALFGGRKVDVATAEILDNPFRRDTITPELRTLYAA